MIKSRGEKFAPKEVESVLNELSGVMVETVAGVPDQLLGNFIKSIIVRNGSELSGRKVLAHCRTRLEDAMIPNIVEFRESIPKSPSGKVFKQGLV